MSHTSLYASFHQTLQNWYEKYGRKDLPWRNTDDPYHIYVSEIMLQQTQVKTVLERYYHPFLQRFPSLKALADAPLEEVLKVWEGLGYYSRARNLHKAAQTTTPVLPDTFEGLITLPGIGKNTAHAILAFAFHKPVPVMEANVKRLLHRIFAKAQMSESALWQAATDLLDTNNPFDYNQAMMDLGAMICTPRQPLCHSCPAHAICKGKDNPEAYPAKKAKKKTPVRRKNILVVTDAAWRSLLLQRESRFLGGLYGFPEIAHDQFECHHNGHRFDFSDLEPVGHVTQTYSHFQLQADIYHLTLDEHKDTWHAWRMIEVLPLSRADQKILRLMQPYVSRTAPA